MYECDEAASAHVAGSRGPPPSPPASPAKPGDSSPAPPSPFRPSSKPLGDELDRHEAARAPASATNGMRQKPRTSSMGPHAAQAAKRRTVLAESVTRRPAELPHGDLRARRGRRILVHGSSLTPV